MSLVDWLAMIFIFAIPVVFIVLILCQHLLGSYLSKKYDPYLFKPPYFTVGETVVYSSWPLNLIKMAMYILYAAYPGLLEKRRFKGFLSPYVLGKSLIFCCRLWVLALSTSIVAVPFILLLMFILPR